jgi:Uma2 family endonuclease
MGSWSNGYFEPSSEVVCRMAVFVTDPAIEEQLLAARAASGANRYDEVWDGVHVMAPVPNDEHQLLVSRIGYILEDIVGLPGLGEVRPGINLSARRDDWECDYRVSDLAVFLRAGTADNLETHWCGPADFLIEIVSPHDRTREKIAFYTRIGVRELLLIDRDPWSLELLRHERGELRTASLSDPRHGGVVSSGLVPLTFRLTADSPRPRLEIVHLTTGRHWLI